MASFSVLCLTQPDNIIRQKARLVDDIIDPFYNYVSLKELYLDTKLASQHDVLLNSKACIYLAKNKIGLLVSIFCFEI